MNTFTVVVFISILVVIPISHLVRSILETQKQIAQSSPFDQPQPTIKFAPEVKKALEKGLPVIALESTIISHGMPYPENFETAVAVENEVRKEGGTPATIAILNGVVHVGLTTEELQALARLGKEAKKCSRRDIGALVASSLDDGELGGAILGKGTGATTVAATAYLARLAHPDLRVFVTGGIGGVHRGWTSTMDISADLTELGRTDITVVCAGAKSILDIPATLEYLETQGVVVVAYKSDYFPAFFTANSTIKAPHRADTPKEIAKMINANRIMKLQSGMVIGVPISRQDEMDAVHIEEAIQQALTEANQLKLAGKDITPFLLEKVNDLTEGGSLRSNIQLIKQNARVGTQIARELNLLQRRAPKIHTTPSATSLTDQYGAATKNIAVFGGAVVDMVATPNGELIMGASNPGSI